MTPPRTVVIVGGGLGGLSAAIHLRLAGFDVVTFSAGTSPECSPLTCCGLAAELGANGHCLFDSFDQARQALESSRFANSEPGPFRIFAVYTVP